MMNGTEQILEETKFEEKYFFYETEEKIIGPISEKKFYDLIIKNSLSHETLFWEQGTTAWRKVGEAYKVVTPPPLPLSHISNGVAITIAVMPFFQMWGLRLIDKSFGAEFANFYSYSPTLFGIALFMYFLITVNLFLLFDIFSLEKKNIKIGKAMLLLGNLVPTYLFYRGTLLARASGKTWNISHFLAFVWIFSAVHSYKWNLY
jgi:hypothetical protein